MDEGMSGFCIKAGAGGGGGGGGHHHGNGTGTKCGRWNPTAEQVKVLTELFRSGLRTPSTDQIQKISTQLSFYGKIESKNVFYWFQNHKARERQKRRKVSSAAHDHDHRDHDHDHHHHHQIHHHHHHKDFICRVDMISSPKHFIELNHHHHHQHHQPERVIETLQLFPLNSFEEESEPEKLRSTTIHATDATPFSYTIGTQMDHPPLDLRLSFL